ncbi:MAG TPA: hypothetical protein VD998_03015 [Verrucomicrobiae bacterium]|nr:hypothetical protein [Verrucomicrobiae bacterium]
MPRSHDWKIRSEEQDRRIDQAIANAKRWCMLIPYFEKNRDRELAKKLHQLAEGNLYLKSVLRSIPLSDIPEYVLNFTGLKTKEFRWYVVAPRYLSVYEESEKKMHRGVSTIYLRRRNARLKEELYNQFPVRKAA